MELQLAEIQIVSETVASGRTIAIQELTDVELAYVGGGTGDVILG